MANPFLDKDSANNSSLKQYSDFDLSFLPNPVSGDLRLKTGVDAIKQSLKNLILTNFFERAFKPLLGSNIENSLFEPLNRITALRLKNAILDIVNVQEPRVSLVQLDIKDDPDNNLVHIFLNVMIKTTRTPASINITLDRIR